MKPLLIALLTLGCASASAQDTYTLQQLTDSALRHNIAVRTARHGIESSTEQRREAFTKYFPTVSGTAAWFNANEPLLSIDLSPMGMPAALSMVKDGTMAGVTALQPIFAGGQIVNGNRLARVGEEAARLQLRLSENEVEETTSKYFWQLATLQEKLNTVEALDTLLADIEKDVATAVRAGIALRNDLLQIELRRNDLKSRRLTLDNGLNVTRLLLAQYCGIEAEGLAVAFDTIDTEQPQGGIFNFQSSIFNLSEYQLLEKQAEAAKLQRKMAVGENLPTVAVGAAYSYHNLMDKSENRALLLATVKVPITAWWGGSHAIRRKKIAERQAQEQLEDGGQLLMIRMQNARNAAEEARSQLELSIRSTEQAAENLRLHRDYYRAGTATMSDLLEAQLLYQQTLDKRVETYATLQEKLLEYRHAVGE